jgi:hypothetical protein
MLFLGIVLTLGYYKIIVDETRLKKLAGYKFSEGNPEITPAIALNTISSCVTAGILAGMIGLGNKTIFFYFIKIFIYFYFNSGSSFLVAPVFNSFGIPPLRSRSTGIFIGMFATFVPFTLSLQAGVY